MSLRDLADKKGIKIGSAMRGKKIFGSTLAAEFNAVTPEGGFLFYNIHPKPATYNFSESDGIASFAQRHNQQFEGGHLISGGGLPDWTATLSPTEIRVLLREHVTTIIQHHSTVSMWQPVNEVIDWPGNVKPNIWSGAYPTPLDYVKEAFLTAHEANPTAKLYWNETGCEWLSVKSNALFWNAIDLRNFGIPIHGIGMQMHLNLARPLDLDSFAINLKRFISAGFDVRITEMDVRLHVADGITSAELDAQKKLYHDVLAIAIANGVKSIMFWGFSDKNSWVPHSFPGYGAALLFDANCQKKPAYYGIEEALTK